MTSGEAYVIMYLMKKTLTLATLLAAAGILLACATGTKDPGGPRVLVCEVALTREP